MRDDICIRNAVWLYGHFADQVLAAQPSSSAIEHDAIGLADLHFQYTRRGKIPIKEQVYIPRAPIAKTDCHH